MLKWGVNDTAFFKVKVSKPSSARFWALLSKRSSFELYSSEQTCLSFTYFSGSRVSSYCLPKPMRLSPCMQGCRWQGKQNSYVWKVKLSSHQCNSLCWEHPHWFFGALLRVNVNKTVETGKSQTGSFKCYVIPQLNNLPAVITFVTWITISFFPSTWHWF